MAFTAKTEPPPLWEDAAGALRVGDSRVLLELVIWAFQDGRDSRNDCSTIFHADVA